MNYRHEWKHEISYADLLTLRARLGAVMQTDPHAVNGQYTIRSVYFDTPYDKALREKTDGIDRREKFRIRFYNGDLSRISIEKKCKINGLCRKESACITEAETRRLAAGDIDFLLQSDAPLRRELYSKMKGQGLRPKTIVDYTREPFVYVPGNVRVTLDYNIRTGAYRTDFLSADTLTLPAGDAPVILEVKWDAYLPDIIRDAVSLPSRRASAFSKYAQCRIYG